MIVKLGFCACVVRPSTCLWRNDGFLHSFCNFSKNDAFGKNSSRTKFILHEIFFRLSILSSRLTSWCSSIYVKKIAKTIGRRTWPFCREGVSGVKNQYNVFCRCWGFEYFSYNNFFKKNEQYFPKKPQKIIFGGRDHSIFQGMEC